MLLWIKKACIIHLIPLQAFHLKKKKKTFSKLEGKQKRKRGRGGWGMRTSTVVKTPQTRKNTSIDFAAKHLDITQKHRKTKKKRSYPQIVLQFEKHFNFLLWTEYLENYTYFISLHMYPN